MADIIEFGGKGRKLDFDPDLTLDQLKGKLQAFVLVGQDHNGNEVTAITYGNFRLNLIQRLTSRLCSAIV